MKATRWGRILLVTLLMVVVMSPSLVWLYAQEEAVPEGESRGFIEMIGGRPVPWLIMGLSVVMLARIIEHFVNVKRDKICPPEIVAEMESLIDEGNIDDAISLATANPGFFTNIMAASLSKANEGFDEMYRVMEETGNSEAIKLQEKISYLNMIGMIGPMLGLLGTVTGMIAAFQVIEKLKSPRPGQLARGVYESLIATALGLFVAIISLSFYYVFKNMVTRIIAEIGVICGEFIAKFRPK